MVKIPVTVDDFRKRARAVPAFPHSAFDDYFARLYNANAKQAGTYVQRDGARKFREQGLATF
jgi:hypothetical protein